MTETTRNLRPLDVPCAGTAPADGAWQFADGRQALYWSIEVLRRRRLPQLSRIWREWMPDVAAPGVPEAWEGDLVKPEWALYLPTLAEDRYLLAMEVDGVLAGMGEDGALLREMAWGDWVTDVRLRGALALQERLRRDGVRMLINYRYTFRQMAEMKRTDAKAVWRRVRRALRELETRLAGKGLMFRPGQGVNDCA